MRTILKERQHRHEQLLYCSRDRAVQVRRAPLRGTYHAEQLCAREVAANCVRPLAEAAQLGQCALDLLVPARRAARVARAIDREYQLHLIAQLLD